MKAPRPARLFVGSDLSGGARLDIDRSQTNHLVGVLRMKDGDPVFVFNGRDGEWTARLIAGGRKRWLVEVATLTRPQPEAPDLHYLFAPLKQARLDYMVQKSVEMGAGRLRPVLTQHGQVVRVSRDRMAANAIEAAEQCGLLSIPTIDAPVKLMPLIATWAEHEGGRRIVFCDEAEERADPLSILPALGSSPLAVLIGPEGGFSDEERHGLRSRPFVTSLPLGPRILRADTAAVAALAIVQAATGDWRNQPPAPHEQHRIAAPATTVNLPTPSLGKTTA